MRARRTTLLAVALALLGAAPPAARAQDPSPTATPTASPTATPSASSADAKTDWPKDVQRVYDDYRQDGVIDVCKHTQKALQDTLDTIQPAYDQDYPDFREAVKAGIERHKAGRCSSASATPTATATATATPTASGAAPPSASPSPSAGVESGQLPQSHAGGGGSHRAVAPQTGALPSTTPAAGATPAATPAPVATAAAAATPGIVNEGHRSLTVPAILVGIALLGGLALGLSALAARRSPRLHHAWREAAFRTRGTWADFSDWLRLGR
jgi:hypothetical protein